MHTPDGPSGTGSRYCLTDALDDWARAVDPGEPVAIGSAFWTGTAQAALSFGGRWVSGGKCCCASSGSSSRLRRAVAGGPGRPGGAGETGARETGAGETGAGECARAQARRVRGRRRVRADAGGPLFDGYRA